MNNIRKYAKWVRSFGNLEKIAWTENVRNEKVFRLIYERRSLLKKLKERKNINELDRSHLPKFIV